MKNRALNVVLAVFLLAFSITSTASAASLLRTTPPSAKSPKVTIPKKSAHVSKQLLKKQPSALVTKKSANISKRTQKTSRIVPEGLIRKR